MANGDIVLPDGSQAPPKWWRDLNEKVKQAVGNVPDVLIFTMSVLRTEEDVPQIVGGVHWSAAMMMAHLRWPYTEAVTLSRSPTAAAHPLSDVIGMGLPEVDAMAACFAFLERENGQWGCKIHGHDHLIARCVGVIQEGINFNNALIAHEQARVASKWSAVRDSLRGER